MGDVCGTIIDVNNHGCKNSNGLHICLYIYIYIFFIGQQCRKYVNDVKFYTNLHDDHTPQNTGI